MSAVTEAFDKFAGAMAMIAEGCSGLDPVEARRALNLALQIVEKECPSAHTWSFSASPVTLHMDSKNRETLWPAAEEPLKSPAKAPGKARKARKAPKQPRTTAQVLEVLQKTPEPVKVSEMADYIGVSAGSASASLRKLTADGKAKLVSRGKYSRV